MTSPRVSATCRPQPWWQESHSELCSGSQAPLAMNKCFRSLTGTQSFLLACCVRSEDVPFSVPIVAVRHFPLSLHFSKSHSWPLARLLSVCRPSGLTGGSAPGPPFPARSRPRARGPHAFLRQPSLQPRCPPASSLHISSCPCSLSLGACATKKPTERLRSICDLRTHRPSF